MCVLSSKLRGAGGRGYEEGVIEDGVVLGWDFSLVSRVR